MGRRAQILLVSVVALLCALAVAAYAIDRANSDKIANGIRVGGVDVGGMSADQAKTRLHSKLVKPLDKPVTVTYNGTKYVLNPDNLQVRADIDGMVDAALRASRSGGFPTRVWRYTTGGEVDREIAPHITYSAKAVDEFVNTVANEVNQPAQDATISPTPTSLNPVPGHDGVQVLTDKLRTELRGAIESPRDRTVEAPVQKVKPNVSTDQLAQKYPVYLTIDRGAFQLRLWQNLKLVKTYTIAVGMQGLETPAGIYTIDDKQVNPSWHVPDSAWAGSLAGQVIPPGPDDPLKARWMGFYNGAGIHGTDEVSSLGTAASHGCIRMAIPDVIELYNQVPLGTPIYIGN
ncbi:MAG TPA: L,D-transpeptidase/peptidoglycan binding protein [Solirubrobacterales bacterium]|jgi:lipoprotein-anchoring transpeptidase ErfK/SrfK|nr:L,D-transpeptidase/peptidoglycan binding protein [Solirubrobacterales bacterium]